MFQSAPKAAGRSSQGGFTLIELVVVIVILGILAAFAVPRFARLDGQARIASVRSLEGSLRSAAAMTHGMWLAAGNTPATVAVEGATIGMNVLSGYPNATTAGIQAALIQNTVVPNTPGKFTSTVTGNAIEFRMNGAPNGGARCRVTYNAATALNTMPNIVIDVAAANC
jgi:MSHA pilin protein MshA